MYDFLGNSFRLVALKIVGIVETFDPIGDGTYCTVDLRHIFLRGW